MYVVVVPVHGHSPTAMKSGGTNGAIQEASIADRLVNAIIAAGLCDPGASGPTARLARLPVAVNGKHDPSFPCRLKIWQPDLRYSFDDLVDGLELDINQAGRSKRNARVLQTESSDAGEEIFIPRPDENVVLSELKARGLYKMPLGGNKHDITCPWVVLLWWLFSWGGLSAVFFKTRRHLPPLG